jgi:hypothetical protein
MEVTLDEVRLELASIHEQLLALAPDAFAARVELRERQNELRALSRDLVAAKEVHEADSLRSAYVRLQEVRDSLIRASHGTRAISAGEARDAIADSVMTAIDAGVGRAALETLLEEILEKLRSSQE